MRPVRRSVDWSFELASNRVVYQPLGVVGVLSPWNYPANLALVPTVNALAAGNRVMLRPSSQTPRTAEVLRQLIEAALPADVAQVVVGSREVAYQMLELPFDHLVFTGSTSVGRSVMRAAAENLTPVTLELCGKSPAVVHPTYPVKKAAERIIAGKLLNAGQTCFAPDYVFVHRDMRDAFVAAAAQAINSMYPNARDNPQYASIQGAEHAARLRELVADAKEKGAQIVEPQAEGAETAGSNALRFAPLLATGVTEEMRLAQDEIFGPILPVREYDVVEDVFSYIAQQPRPLALYYFDSDEGRIARFQTDTVSAGPS